jgi:Tetratricopeptide repeat
MPLLRAQSAPEPQDPGTSQTNSPASTQRPPSQRPKPSESNPFPEDTTTVPVVPTNAEPATLGAPAPSSADSGTTSLLGEDSDPIHSPDDVNTSSSGSDSGFSSSLQGIDDVRPPADIEKPGKHQKLQPAPHQETAKEDEDIGAYYLTLKKWKAALSRFESALVTDPENPDVYWGLAESQRQLGDYANAKSNYLKVVEYDPDSKHGKEANKLLKQPELAHAPAVSSNQPAAQPQQ